MWKALDKNFLHYGDLKEDMQHSEAMIHFRFVVSWV